MKNAALASIAHRVARRHTPNSQKPDPELPVRIDLPGAKVMLLPGRFRDAAYIKTHVEYVLSRPAEIGEAHVINNLRCIRQNLEAIGISRPEIDAEVRRIEGAVRAEIWRQVLFPGGDA